MSAKFLLPFVGGGAVFFAPRQVAPFIRWVGGKQQLIKHILPLLPPDVTTWAVELSDANARLVATYVAVRDHLPELISTFRCWPDREDLYLEKRARLNSVDPWQNPIETAALMIYLNKTGFNGLYRENSRGGMNAPYGHSAKYPNRWARGAICNVEVLTTASHALQNVTIRHADFRSALATARSGDVAYLDPPYPPAKPNGFCGYVAGAEDVYALNRAVALECRRLDELGVRFLASNADLPLVREIYAGFNLLPVAARRMVNSVGSARGPVGELLIRNY